VKISKNTWLKGISLSQSASFELLCVEIGSRVCVPRNIKTKTKIIIIIKRHATRIFQQHVGAPPLIRSSPNLAELLQISNQLIHKCGFGKWLKFHVLAILQRSPLTRLSPVGLRVIVLGN